MSQNLSRIRKYPVLVPFALNIVSGVVKQGSLIVSWNSGVEATEQIDYGVGDDSVPNTTPVKLLEPGDRGYVEGKDIKLYRTNHIVPFPETFVDTTHFFRVRSTSRRNETLESEVFRVYVTEKVVRRSYMATIQVRVEPVSMTESKQKAMSVLETAPDGDTDNLMSAEGIETIASKEDKTVNPENQPVKSVFETNINTTIT
jgi:hypothetical protein